MIRGVITVNGDVQDAGYRAFVRDTARKLGLVGFAENMPDGTVNVVCEGEKKKIETLVGSIKIKTETINVEKIDVVFEDATNEFKGKGFVVKVGDLGQEMFQGYATSLKYFRVGWDKQDKMLGEQDAMHNDMNKSFSQLNGNMNKNFNQLNKTIGTKFESMDVKYGDISKTMREMHNDLKEMKNLFAKLVNHIVKK